jgi:hypothetical protein
MTQTADADAPRTSFLAEVKDAVTDEATAREKILNRDIDGAQVIDPAGTTDRPLVATGGGTVPATTLEKLTTAIEAAERRTVRTVDVAPASAQDFDGLSLPVLSAWAVAGSAMAPLAASLREQRHPAAVRQASARRQPIWAPKADSASVTGWKKVSPPEVQSPLPPEVRPIAASPSKSEPPLSPGSAQTSVWMSPLTMSPLP